MRTLLPVFFLISEGVLAHRPDSRRPSCKNPSGKLWSSVLDRNCGQAVCKKDGKKAFWESCPRPATEQQLDELETKMKNDTINVLAAQKRVEDRLLIRVAELETKMKNDTDTILAALERIEETLEGPEKLEDAVLIAVGRHNRSVEGARSVEVFFPRTRKGCIVPDYEFSVEPYRDRITLNTIEGETIMCKNRECYQLTPNSQNVWSKYAKLNKSRFMHVAWESSQGLVLMSGDTAELVNGGLLPFTPLHRLLAPCAITDTDTDSVILTGGNRAVTNVTRYNLKGFVEELPFMNHGRGDHGCGAYKDETTNTLVLIVAGGYTSTTEKLLIGDDSWKVINPLPRAMYGLSDAFITVNNKIYMFGGQIYIAEMKVYTVYEDILEYNDKNEKWEKVGEMKVKRSYHGTAPIKGGQETLCGAE